MPAGERACGPLGTLGGGGGRRARATPPEAPVRAGSERCPLLELHRAQVTTNFLYHGRAFTLDVVSNFITVGHGLFFFRVAMDYFFGWPWIPF